MNAAYYGIGLLLGTITALAFSAASIARLLAALGF